MPDTPPEWTTLKRTIQLKTPIFSVQSHLRAHPDTPHDPAEFWSVSPSDWVNIIALTPEQEVVLVTQYRHGTNNITLEIPGGALDPDEDPLDAAQRELLEETGYSSTQWIKLGDIAVNPAMMTNHCTTFLAKDALQTHPQNLDEHEDITVSTLPVARFLDLIDQGHISHGIVVSAAYFLLRHLQRTTP